MSHFDDGALHAYLDGALAPAEWAQIEAHVTECAACRTRLDEQRVLIQRASQLLGFVQPPPPERAAPPPLHQLRHPRPVWRLRMPLTWAASVVLALAVGYYAGESSDDPAPQGAERDAVVGVTAAPPAPPAPVSTGLSDRSTPEQARQPRAARPPATPTEPAARDQPTALPGQLFGEAVRAREENAKVAAELSAVVVTATVDGDLVSARDRLDASDWPVIGRDPARELLGTDPVGVPGLAVRETRRNPAGDGVVLVEQQVDSTTVIQLFQRRAVQPDVGRGVVTRGAVGAARAAAPDVRATERLARFVGSLRVEIAGPLTSDSLNKLLEQLKPIP